MLFYYVLYILLCIIYFYIYTFNFTAVVKMYYGYGCMRTSANGPVSHYSGVQWWMKKGWATLLVGVSA